ncbi:MAG: DNA-3-methyladenine glycosylase 2 family protein [Clostridia bacterium]|nr:DNA-3-methyladenine glycosylase 2 family protein [Clostridia bacterium]
MEKITAKVTDTGVPYVHLTNIPKIDIFKTFDCGQCFRFDPVQMYGNEYEYGGVAYGKYVVFAQNSPYELKIYGTTPEEYDFLWRSYLALDTDYEDINNCIISVTKSHHMERAVLYGDGIRILRQEPWEAVCSFIISQNNNIPRIKKIISALCERYGAPIVCGKNTYYAFPDASTLFEAGEEAIFALKTGFRAKYIIDASRSVSTNETDLSAIIKEESFDTCVDILCKIKGVGLKVASCALLFGFGKTEAFPIDVWMRRALEKYFPDGIDIKALGKSAGIAQQYLFYYERYNKDEI